MTKIEVTKIEEQLHGRVLYNFRALTSQGRVDLPIAVQTSGSAALDESAVLRAVGALSENLAELVRVGLPP